MTTCRCLTFTLVFSLICVAPGVILVDPQTSDETLGVYQADNGNGVSTSESDETLQPHRDVRFVKRADYIEDGEELERVLETLRKQAQDSIRDNPQNYVRDEDLEKILSTLNDNGDSTEATTSGTNEAGSSGEQMESQRSTGFKLDEKLPTGLKQSILASLIEPHDGQIESRQAECPICFDDMTTAESVTLSCGHVIHRDCLEKWALKDPHPLIGEENGQKQVHCPYCRQASHWA